ncbi:hypothetical protein CABS01_07554 [Colletotrichum abscissum]|uniref:Uncharacterized protein n=3 Tax=Colletotrichum acutatum species complex TaxID=2707335 RepID=A0AAI9YR26_9PEZI|nr:uncharacterized protein CCOS01_11326 [Colletotrichum costaricense]XP_060376519.1 uncharacterized protein CTAM01_12888 [Colletotrichum tamarilloi]XP_060403084.1 uncharacterized protein CABS01_07554 [Colletotrichum abscissum]KAI3528369.1 hypothetical protein CSPX01_16291 [Colletotrichum filicis]KAK1461504.1 hypothetical protein CMEL01_14458 [Colletotrichum melonis]KAK1484644.1 hypothetical protein CTAM01_12888 [Colletotrichum tamarilloi]KAK1511596.1 hypothetical protein CABS01_07554 [Colleto
MPSHQPDTHRPVLSPEEPRKLFTQQVPSLTFLLYSAPYPLRVPAPGMNLLGLRACPWPFTAARTLSCPPPARTGALFSNAKE